MVVCEWLIVLVIRRRASVKLLISCPSVRVLLSGPRLRCRTPLTSVTVTVDRLGMLTISVGILVSLVIREVC